MVLIVGLGNPGARYESNRHNIGFMVVDAIARRLGISPRTVHRHLDNLYPKLDAPDRLSAVLRAQALHLIKPSTPDTV